MSYSRKKSAALLHKLRRLRALKAPHHLIQANQIMLLRLRRGVPMSAPRIKGSVGDRVYQNYMANS